MGAAPRSNDRGNPVQFGRNVPTGTISCLVVSDSTTMRIRDCALVAHFSLSPEAEEREQHSLVVIIGPGGQAAVFRTAESAAGQSNPDLLLT